MANKTNLNSSQITAHDMSRIAPPPPRNVDPKLEPMINTAKYLLGNGYVPVDIENTMKTQKITLAPPNVLINETYLRRVVFVEKRAFPILPLKVTTSWIGGERSIFARDIGHALKYVVSCVTGPYYRPEIQRIYVAPAMKPAGVGLKAAL